MPAGGAAPGGTPRQGPSGFGDKDALALARELSSEFTKAGKSKGKPATKGKDFKAHDFSFAGGNRGLSRPQDKNLDNSNHSSPKREGREKKLDSSYSGAGPPPSQRNYSSLMKFAPNSENSTTMGHRWISGADARAWVNGHDKKQSDEQSAKKAQPLQQPTKAPTTTAKITPMNKPSLTQKTYPTTTQVSVTKSTADNAQPAQAPGPHVPLHPPPVMHNNAPTPGVAAQHDNPSLPSNQPGADVKSVDQSLSRDSAAAPSQGATRVAPINSPVTVNDVPEQRPSPAAKKTLAVLGVQDVLAQIRAKYILSIQDDAKQTASTPEPTSVEPATKPRAEVSTHSKASQDLKSSTGSASSVVQAFKALKLEDSQDHQAASIVSEQSAQPVQPEVKQQQIASEGRLLYTGAKAWIAESKVKEEAIVSGTLAPHKSPVPTETTPTEDPAPIAPAPHMEPKPQKASVSSDPPKRKKGPGLESSIFNCPETTEDNRHEHPSNLSAQAGIFSPSSAGTIKAHTNTTSFPETPVEPPEHVVFYPTGYSAGFLYTATQVHLADGYIIPGHTQSQLTMQTPVGITPGHVATGNQDSGTTSFQSSLNPNPSGAHGIFGGQTLNNVSSDNNHQAQGLSAAGSSTATGHEGTGAPKIRQGLKSSYWATE